MMTALAGLMIRFSCSYERETPRGKPVASGNDGFLLSNEKCSMTIDK